MKKRLSRILMMLTLCLVGVIMIATSVLIGGIGGIIGVNRK